MTTAALLPIILQEEKSLSLAVYDESAVELKRVEEPPTGEDAPYTGDYTESTICFHPTLPCFAHVTTTQLRYSEVVPSPATGSSGKVQSHQLRTLFAIDVPHVVKHMMFSPRGTFFVTFANFDARRTPDGNLSVYDMRTQPPQLLRRVQQSWWPGLTWTAEEDFAVRWVQGGLQVFDKELTEGLGKLELKLSAYKEIDFQCSPASGLPLLSVFRPIEKNRPASFSVYRLPNVREEDSMLQVSFGRAEAATTLWSPSGKCCSLLVKQGGGGNGPAKEQQSNSYYGALTLHLVDVFNREVKDVRLSAPGVARGGPVETAVHACCWHPQRDELLVIHGSMPRNHASIINPAGVVLFTFGEGPRNMALWSGDGLNFMVGGSGNLAGDYQLYAHSASSSSPTGSPLTSSSPAAADASKCIGTFSEKCSVEQWAPDSHHIAFSTIFTRLRVDNKLVIAKKNGARMLTTKFANLYGAYWVPHLHTYPTRPASPRPPQHESPKPQAYRPPGGTSVRAAALLRGPDPHSATAVSSGPAGPIGAKLVTKKKKGKR